MPQQTDPNKLTVLDKEPKQPASGKPIKNADDSEEVGEREMDQAIQDEEVKEEQRRDAGND